jgi:ABC-type nitrate/sulfonate/bicarbonate transport system substrate-binding protein
MIAKKTIFLIILGIIILAIIGTYFGVTLFRGELHFVHSTILNQYLYAWDKGIVSHPVTTKTTIVEDPEALGPYLMGRSAADLVEAATVLAGIAYSKNPKVRIVGSLTKSGNADSVVVVRKDSGITSPKDLKGKIVGTPGLAMTHCLIPRTIEDEIRNTI